jgi:anti-sigma factor RsiW
MTCQQLTDFIADYLSGQLSTGQRQAFERHIDVCATCRRYIDSYRKTMEVARRVESSAPEPIPDELVRAILASAKK